MCGAQAQVEGNPTFDAPIVRLAATTAMTGTADTSGADRYPHHVEPGDGGPVLRPALLVSYVYLEQFAKNRHRFNYRDWVLDSGAYSAHNSGTEVNLQKYIDVCKQLQAEDRTLTEVFALDVIGDWKASLKNCETMWAQGVEAIPTFHVGEPESALLGMARDYPKIALGGCVRYRKKDEFAAQCFARVWPKKIHGFGFWSEPSLLKVPWHSVDATSWEIRPCQFGKWQSFGGATLSVRGSKQNLRAEVEWYLKLEQRARQRWKKEMAELEALTAPSVRLAVANATATKMDQALKGPPSVRLAVAGLTENRTACLLQEPPP
jgi:hypothetical protein